jgi:tripartite-type tricarboxylate transporter receptor subunit TctC
MKLLLRRNFLKLAGALIAAPALPRLASALDYPTEIVDKLNKEINAAIADSGMKARLAAIGGDPMPGTPADFGRLITEEPEKWGKVVRTGGLKPE